MFRSRQCLFSYNPDSSMLYIVCMLGVKKKIKFIRDSFFLNLFFVGVEVMVARLAGTQAIYSTCVHRGWD